MAVCIGRASASAEPPHPSQQILVGQHPTGRRALTYRVQTILRDVCLHSFCPPGFVHMCICSESRYLKSGKVFVIVSERIIEAFRQLLFTLLKDFRTTEDIAG